MPDAVQTVKLETGDSPSAEIPLISLTSLAADKVREILDAERDAGNVEEDMGLRMRVVGGGCSGFSYDLYFDSRTELDRVWQIHGVDVMVDEMSLMYLLGTEIDYVEGLAGAGFKFNNPNVKSTCGCGSSFAV